MKKSVFLAALGAITIVCIIYGSIKHLHISPKKTNHKGFVSWVLDLAEDAEFADRVKANYDDDDDDIIENDVEDADGTNGNFSASLEPFNSIQMNNQVTGLRIEEGSSYRIEAWYTKKKLKPEFEVSNGVLKVTQTAGRVNSGNQNCRVVITVPKDTYFDSLDLNINVGDLVLRRMAGNSVNAQINVGAIDLRDSDFKRIDLETNVGAICADLAGKLSDYEMNLSTDIGLVSVDGNTFKRHYEARGNGSRRIKAVTNVGQIEIHNN